MKHTTVQNNFVRPVITPDDYVFGKVGGEPLRDNGDWRNYLTGDEDQKKHGVETSACATYNTIHPIAILQEETYDLKDQDYAERFISMLSGTTRQGNSPNKVAQAIRDYGLIPQSMLPFNETIDTWEKFNSYFGGDESLCLKAGIQWKKKWDFNYEWVWTGDLSVENKHARLKEALKYSPVGVSVNAWYEDNGVYVKPNGSQDNHWTVLVAFEDGYPIVWDTYAPYIKKLSKDYDFEWAMRYAVKKKPEVARRSFIQFIKDICFSVINLLRF